MGKPLQYHVFVAYLGVHQKLDQVHLDRWTQDVILWNWTDRMKYISSDAFPGATGLLKNL